MAVTASTPPWISVIVPCKGQSSELRSCLKALADQEGGIPFEVIVVDSASDPQVESVVRDFPSVRLVRSQGDLSAGAARNLGAANARADVLGFVDADCVPEAGWVQAARSAIADGAVLASGPVLDAMPWNWVASTDNRLQFADFPAGRPAGSNSYFSGTHLVVLREAFDLIGGFDAGLNVVQDVLFTEAAAARWPGKTLFGPPLIVRHQGRSGWRAFWRHQWQFGRSRAEYNLRMSNTLTWLGRHSSLGWMVLLRRWLYISARVVQWNLRDLPRYLWQSPVMLVGLIAWTRGFYAGRRGTPVAGS